MGEVVIGVGPGADFLPGPEQVDRRIEVLPEMLPVAGRTRSENLLQNGVKAVIGRAEDQVLGGAGLGRDMGQGYLAFSQLGQVAAHIVEQQSHQVRFEAVQRLEFPCQGLPALRPGLPVELQGAESYSKADTLRPAGVA